MSDLKINSLDVIHDQIVFDSKDYSVNKKDIVMYAIVVGWDAASYNQLLGDGKLTMKQIDNLRNLNKQFNYYRAKIGNPVMPKTAKT